MIKSFARSFVFVFAFSLFVSAAGRSARADIVLVFGDQTSSRTSLATALESLGHTVTNVSVLPANLSGYQVIWHVGTTIPLTSGERAELQGFLAGGGGVHLTGERPCCEPSNDSLELLVNSVVSGGGVNVGGQGDINGPYSFNPGALGGVSNSPNSLTTWAPTLPGGISGISGANVLASGAGGHAVGGIWDASNMISGAGRLTILMDANWFSTSSNLAAIQNIETFLAIPSPTAGALGVVGIATLVLTRSRRRISSRCC